MVNIRFCVSTTECSVLVKRIFLGKKRALPNEYSFSLFGIFLKLK